MHEFLEGLLRHKSDMVNIEAARAICDIRSVTLSDLVRPVAGKYIIFLVRHHR
jgi:coatomer protein complex subunit gamma